MIKSVNPILSFLILLIPLFKINAVTWKINFVTFFFFFNMPIKSLFESIYKHGKSYFWFHIFLSTLAVDTSENQLHFHYTYYLQSFPLRSFRGRGYCTPPALWFTKKVPLDFHTKNEHPPWPLSKKFALFLPLRLKKNAFFSFWIKKN